MMDAAAKDKAQARLKRVAGQIGGIQRMVDGDRYCVDVLMQIQAARAALAKVGQMLLESHIKTCVAHAFDDDDPKHREATIAELIQVFEKSCNC